MAFFGLPAFTTAFAATPVLEPQVSAAPLTSPWSCTLVVPPGVSINEVLKAANGEVFVTVGHVVEYNSTPVSVDDSVFDASCPVEGKEAIELSGQSMNLPYYKSIVIFFISKIIRELGQTDAVVWFESMEQKTMTFAPDWFEEVFRVQSENGGIDNVLTWSLEVRPNEDWHTMRRRGLRFCGERHNSPTSCVLISKPDACVISGLTLVIDRRSEDALMKTVQDLNKYLHVTCCRNPIMPKVSFRTLSAFRFPSSK